MCGRAALTNETLEEIADALEAQPVSPELYRPRYNLAPSDQVWIVVADGPRRLVAPATWGLPPPEPSRPGSGRRRPLINVRAESVRNGSFRTLFQAGRCAFVSSGFYEWNAARLPFFFRPAGGGLLLLGALCRPGIDGAPPATAVLTSSPNELVAKVHDRMPVVIPTNELDSWLRGDPVAAAQWLKPAPSEALTCTRVSRRVGAVRHDDPSCLAPLTDEEREEGAAPPAAEEQLRLFR